MRNILSVQHLFVGIRCEGMINIIFKKLFLKIVYDSVHK